MQDAGTPTEVFEKVRPRLTALAYRMLGSVDEAEDVVQETFLRWHSAARHRIVAPEAWLMTTCTRLSIDTLRRAYRQRETYLGPWIPEPVVEDASRRADRFELADSLSIAFLLLLERLSPLERAAFLLHDVFDYGYSEVAAALDRGEAACRQLVSRARRHLRGQETRFTADPGRAAELLDRFLAAARDGEVEQLKEMLAEQAEMWSDGGGEVAAARNVLRGRERVARFLAGVARKEAGVAARPVQVNGCPGALIEANGRVIGVISITLDDSGRVDRLFLQVNPRKLTRAAAHSSE